MKRTARKHPLAFLSLGVAAVALLIHLVSVFADAPPPIWMVFLIFPIGLLCFGALIHTANGRARDAGDQRATPFQLIAPLPTWARVLVGLVFLYTGLNFLWFMQATGGGGLEQQRGGGYVLSDHGRVIRVLDDAGVQAFRAWEVRLFSGHILPFLVLPGLYFLYTPRRQGPNT